MLAVVFAQSNQGWSIHMTLLRLQLLSEPTTNQESLWHHLWCFFCSTLHSLHSFLPPMLATFCHLSVLLGKRSNRYRRYIAYFITSKRDIISALNFVRFLCCCSMPWLPPKVHHRSFKASMSSGPRHWWVPSKEKGSSLRRPGFLLEHASSQICELIQRIRKLTLSKR